MGRFTTTLHVHGAVNLDGGVRDLYIQTPDEKIAVRISDLSINLPVCIRLGKADNLKSMPQRMGLAFRITLSADDIKAAFTRARYWAELLAGLILISNRAFVDEPREQFCYESGDSISSRSFQQYIFYPEQLPRDGRTIDMEGLHDLFDPITRKDQRTVERMLRALSLYRVASQKIEDIERFLFHWIGLEAMAPLLREHYGTEESWHLAGVKKLFEATEQEDLFRKAKNARDSFSHSFKDFGEVKSLIEECKCEVEEKLVEAFYTLAGCKMPHEVQDAFPKSKQLPPSVTFRGTLVDVSTDELEKVGRLIDPIAFDWGNGDLLVLEFATTLPMDLAHLQIGTFGNWSSQFQQIEIIVNGHKFTRSLS